MRAPHIQTVPGKVSPQNNHLAVVDIDIGTRDLQQCADAVIRLRAEYLFDKGRYDQICFRAVSGDPMPYRSYRRGMRPPRGKAGPWTFKAGADNSRVAFRRYLDCVFRVANTASLERELRAIPDYREVEIGDVFIEAARGGKPGHAVLIMDIAQNQAGQRLFLIAQSYMPAQSIHILHNPGDRQLSPWYRPTADGSLFTPEWRFPPSSLKRFGPSCSR
jgi:hypothetical protein